MTSESIFQNGHVGYAAGFRVHVSNNVPELERNSTYCVIAGVPTAGAYAEELLNLEAHYEPKYFSDVIDGDFAFGTNICNPDQMAMLVCRKR